jgi:hypothetical protein
MKTILCIAAGINVCFLNRLPGQPVKLPLSSAKEGLEIYSMDGNHAF